MPIECHPQWTDYAGALVSSKTLSCGVMQFSSRRRQPWPMEVQLEALSAATSGPGREPRRRSCCDQLAQSSAAHSEPSDRYVMR